MRYEIWRVLVRRSRASSFCAAGKETGGAGGGGGGGGAAWAWALEVESGSGGLALLMVFEGSTGLDELLEALFEAGGLVGAGGLGAGGDAALRGG